MTRLSDKGKILFIMFVTLGIYYPSIFGEINSVDDEDMITTLINTAYIDLKELFLPFKPFIYYRPILWFSFLLDRFLFECNELFMHFNNVLIHTLNGALVFLIARELNKIFKIDNASYYAFFVSLFFVLHPINTESVNFISGRTDLLAGFFTFSAFLIFLLIGLKNYIWCWISSFLYLLALLSKEVAIGLLLAIILFFMIKDIPLESNRRIKESLKLLLPFILITVFYFVLRFIASGRSDEGIMMAVGPTNNTDLLVKLGSAIKAFGFYIKKLFIPIPLNFGIIDINRTFYFWFGLIALAVSLYLLLRRDNLSFYFLLAIIFFLPAIPIAISTIAWTPLAERYLYISSFGISMFVVKFWANLPFQRRLSEFLVLALLIISALITVNRNIIWQSNLALYADTVKKSPNFAPARNEYGLALMRRGRYDEALEQFKQAQKFAGNSKYRELPTLNIIAIEGRNKKPEELKKDYLKVFELTESYRIKSEVLRRLIKITENEIRNNKNKKPLLYKEEIDYLEKLFQLEKNSFYLYRIGQLYLALGDRQKAKKYFNEAIALSSSEEYFILSAKKLLSKIE
jgi:tetratricopeptide (TPR) repeat protein